MARCRDCPGFAGAVRVAFEHNGDVEHCCFVLSCADRAGPGLSSPAFTYSLCNENLLGHAPELALACALTRMITAGDPGSYDVICCYADTLLMDVVDSHVACTYVGGDFEVDESCISVEWPLIARPVVLASPP